MSLQVQTALVESASKALIETPTKSALNGGQATPVVYSNILTGERIYGGFSALTTQSYRANGWRPENDADQISYYWYHYANLFNTRQDHVQCSGLFANDISLAVTATANDARYPVLDRPIQGIDQSIYWSGEFDPFPDPDTIALGVYSIYAAIVNSRFNDFGWANYGGHEQVTLTDTYFSCKLPYRDARRRPDDPPVYSDMRSDGHFTSESTLSNPFSPAPFLSEGVTAFLDLPIQIDQPSQKWRYDCFDFNNAGFGWGLQNIPGFMLNQDGSVPAFTNVPVNNGPTFDYRVLGMHCVCGWAIEGSIGRPTVRAQKGLAWHNSSAKFFWIGKREVYWYAPDVYTYVSCGIIERNKSLGLGGDITIPQPASPTFPLATDSNGKTRVAVFYFAVIGKDPASWAAEHEITLLS